MHCQRLALNCARSGCSYQRLAQIVQDYKIFDCFFFKATAEFLTYEDSVPLLRKQCVFKDYKFYKKDLLVRAVECLPDIPFSDASFLPPPDPAAKKAPPELSAAEKTRLNKFAKILIMSDNRKATAVVDYVKTILERELVPPPDPAPDDQNCAFRAVLTQMPNHEYFFNTETGEAYEAIDLRHQFVSFCVENAEEMFAKLKVTLDKPFKEWFLLQLDPQQESDHSTILALRHMLKVSFI